MRQKLKVPQRGSRSSHPQRENKFYFLFFYLKKKKKLRLQPLIFDQFCIHNLKL